MTPRDAQRIAEEERKARNVQNLTNVWHRCTKHAMYELSCLACSYAAGYAQGVTDCKVQIQRAEQIAAAARALIVGGCPDTPEWRALVASLGAF